MRPAEQIAAADRAAIAVFRDITLSLAARLLSWVVRRSGDGNHMQLPASDEINVHGSLDEESALKHFLGKSLEQAEALFRENSLYYLEDLMWMGPKAFCFYVPAAINYIRSSASTGDSSAISSLQVAVEFRLSDERNELAASLPDLRAGVRYILDNWARFDINPDVYVDLREKYIDLSRQLDAEQIAAANRPRE